MSSVEKAKFLVANMVPIGIEHHTFVQIMDVGGPYPDMQPALVVVLLVPFQSSKHRLPGWLKFPLASLDLEEVEKKITDKLNELEALRKGYERTPST